MGIGLIVGWSLVLVGYCWGLITVCNVVVNLIVLLVLSCRGVLQWRGEKDYFANLFV